jgi:peptide/nickel transport system permease protein
MDNGIAFVLGADALGRPMLLQLIMGARTSLMIAVAAVTIAGIIGYSIGMLSGYVGGWVDAALMRIADIIHTVPSLLLALAILYVLQPSVTNLIMVLVFTRTPMYMRVARARTLEVREGVFVEAARAIGSRQTRIILKDIRPLVTPTILTVAMLEIATVILTAAGLSFLGIGLQRPDVDWGMMVADGRGYLSVAWWVTVFPGIAVVLTALAANTISNWLRAIEDPTQSHLFAKPLAPEAPTPTSSATIGSLS